MAMRTIVNIDAALCNGCGLCVQSCAEGAIQLIAGKAQLVKEQYCDGLGACLGECPQGAITLLQRDADAFDEDAVATHLTQMQKQKLESLAPTSHASSGCPGSMMRKFSVKNPVSVDTAPSALRQWPVQLHLVPPTAPYFHNADLLLAADCAAFACGDFHMRFLTDHAVAIACPKLDETSGYVEKLANIISEGGLRSITIVMMQVPCCHGLASLVEMALQHAGSDIPVYHVIVSIEGKVLSDERPVATPDLAIS